MSSFKTMLAGKVDDITTLAYPRSASPKLDGVRGHGIDGVMVSRNLKPFKNPALQEQFGTLKLHSLDGEFMAGDPTDPAAFRQCGTLNSHSGPVDKVVFWVFDDFWRPHDPFLKRLATAGKRIQLLGRKDVKLVPHKVVHTPEELVEFEAKCLAAGYEGAMSRALDGLYKYGRSTGREGWLIKHKQFSDSEAVIDDAVELLHNANEKTLVSNGKAKRNTQRSGMVGRGTLGAVCVRDLHTGIAFSVGSGFDDAERSDLWKQHHSGNLVGKVIKYQYFPGGSKEKPRFPTFKGFRDEIDL